MDGEKGGWGEGEEGRRWCVALLICLMLMVLFYSLSRIHCYYGFFFARGQISAPPDLRNEKLPALVKKGSFNLGVEGIQGDDQVVK